MNKTIYETDLTGYEFLKYSKNKELLTSDYYKINISKQRIINKTNKILKTHKDDKGYIHLTLGKHKHFRYMSYFIYEHHHNLAEVFVLLLLLIIMRHL